MYFIKPVNISIVERCKFLVIAALATFWASLVAFFLAPMLAFIILLAVHAVALYLACTQCYRVLMFLFLSKDGEGASRAAANSAAADAPV